MEVSLQNPKAIIFMGERNDPNKYLDCYSKTLTKLSFNFLQDAGYVGFYKNFQVILF